MTTICKELGNFCIIHCTMDNENLMAILKSGYIKPGTMLQPKYLKMSTPNEPFDKIFGMLYFEKLKNIKMFQGASIILHPKIIRELGMRFTPGWGGSGVTSKTPEIMIDKNDKLLCEKMRGIYRFIKNPKLPKHIMKMPEHHHEVTFTQKISIEKYCIGVVTEKDISNIMEKKKYDFKIIKNFFIDPISAIE